MQSCSLVLSPFRTTLLITMKFYVTLVLLVVLTTTIDAATTPQGVCASFEQDGLMQSCNDYRNYHGKPDMEHCEAKEKTMTASKTTATKNFKNTSQFATDHQRRTPRSDHI